MAAAEEEMSCRISYAGLGPSHGAKVSCVHGSLWYATVTVEAAGLLAVTTEDPASYFDILILAPVDECDVFPVENPATANPKTPSSSPF